MKSIKVSRKKMLASLIILLILITVISTSFALWQLVISQTEKNIVTSGCFKVTYQDNNSPISMESASPTADSVGLTQTPYTFTITNVCDNYASYQVNLEVLSTTTFLHNESIKIAFQDRNPEILSNRSVADITVDGATDSYMLETGYLNHGESKTFSLKMWLDESLVLTEDMIDAVFDSKITVIANYLGVNPTYEQRMNACLNSGYEEAVCVASNSQYNTSITS